MESAVTESNLQDLSNKIGNSWKGVARQLKIPDAKLENIESNFTTQEEKILQMLLQWKRENGKAATYTVLSDAMRKTGRVDLQEHVVLLAKDLKMDGSGARPKKIRHTVSQERTSCAGEDQRKDYRSVLVDAAKTLTKNDVELLRFECHFERADADQISNGIQLMDKLESTCFITPDNVDGLIKLLERRQLNQAANILKKYKGT